MRRRKSELTSEQQKESLDALYTAAGSIHGRTAMKLFLRDLLTESERFMLGRRILIARALLQGETERNIATEMRVGTDTIYRVARWLNDQFPGYENAIAKLEQEYAKRLPKENAPIGTIRYLKKKYPLHFLLFPPFS